MVRVVASRLMQTGEVALWRDGTLVWCGLVGSDIGDKPFDSISLCVADLGRLQLLVGPTVDRQTIRAAIARWWN